VLPIAAECSVIIQLIKATRQVAIGSSYLKSQWPIGRASQFLYSQCIELAGKVT
jgi:hypothetical protein